MHGLVVLNDCFPPRQWLHHFAWFKTCIYTHILFKGDFGESNLGFHGLHSARMVAVLHPSLSHH